MSIIYHGHFSTLFITFYISKTLAPVWLRFSSEKTLVQKTLMWNKLSWEVRNSKTIRIVLKRLLVKRPSRNSIFDIYKPYGIKLLTRLRLGLSHLNEHRFKHCFNNTINPNCICGGDIESITHLFLYSPECCEARKTLFDNIQSTDKMLLSQNEPFRLNHICSNRK